eukprot:CAMPEP_0117507218 /NCGR_PEP_ID=MMETSP0784-20121206/26313_1 /TAXON_ID=39447 /ORGANISM="" /LENGTH=439 /DNA_ID=CAMNT_0005302721 /DNA_START=51 /DNA_END=1368 /DNA_ORIENTATION=+
MAASASKAIGAPDDVRRRSCLAAPPGDAVAGSSSSTAWARSSTTAVTSRGPPVGGELPRLLGRTRGCNGGGSYEQSSNSDTGVVAGDAELVPSRRDEEAKRNEAGGKGPISILQEFIQCSKEFRLPPRKPILTWAFEKRMEDSAALEFRAIATFLLGSVPHHVAGAWQHTKKASQRDAADRALTFFVGVWGERLLQGKEIEDGSDDVIQLIECVCQTHRVSGDAVPRWYVIHENAQYRAILEVGLLGVPHKFGGPLSASEGEAHTALADRVLWYLQYPGYCDAFEPDPMATAAAVAKPPMHWASDASEEDALQIAERKTAVMRVQNKLQQALAQSLKPGQSVWEWSYEPCHVEGVWPPFCRATVRVPALGVEFTGGWLRGHRDAQLEACAVVEEALKQLDPASSWARRPPNGAVPPPDETLLGRVAHVDSRSPARAGHD